MDRPGRGEARWPRQVAAPILAALLLAAAPAGAQEIIQAQALDLAVLEVQVIVTRTGADDQVRCLLRDAAGRVRVGGTERVAAGAASGRTTVVSIPLPVLNPGETEYAVTLVRGDLVLHRTDWRPLFHRP